MTKPLFDHRHHKEIERIIAMMDYDGPRSDVAVLFMSELEAIDPQFKAPRFYNACMGEPVNWGDRDRTPK